MAALLLAGGSAEATNPPDPPTRPGVEPIVLALDLSGSMNAAVGTIGGTRWDHASTAVIGIIEQWWVGTAAIVPGSWRVASAHVRNRERSE